MNDTDKELIIILTMNGSDIVVWINLFVNGTSYIGKDEFNCKVVWIKFTNEWYRYSGENNFTMNGPDTVVELNLTVNGQIPGLELVYL